MLCCCCVWIGTSWPTVSTASLLSCTTTDGEDSTLTSVSCDSASMVMLLLPGVNRKLKPGVMRAGQQSPSAPR